MFIALLNIYWDGKQTLPSFRELQSEAVKNQEFRVTKSPVTRSIPFSDNLVFMIVKQILFPVSIKQYLGLSWQTSVRLLSASSKNYLCLHFSVVPFSWVHHLSWRIFTIWGRDVIWDSIQRLSENLQYTKKTHLHVLNLTSAISYLNQRQCGKLPEGKLFPSGRFVSWYSGQQGHRLRSCPGVCFKVSDHSGSVCVSLLIQHLCALPLGTECTLSVSEQCLLLLLKSMTGGHLKL